MARSSRLLLAALAATALVAVAPAAASAAVTLDGTFSRVVKKPDAPRCPADLIGECGTLQMAGLGAADYVYEYGPTFEPTDGKHCFAEDGAFTITLQSDGSTISGPIDGIFCTRWSSQASKGMGSAYGNPFDESFTIAFADGTGVFAGLSGT